MKKENAKPHPEVTQISLGVLFSLWWTESRQNTGSGHEEISRAGFGNGDPSTAPGSKGALVSPAWVRAGCGLPLGEALRPWMGQSLEKSCGLGLLNPDF